MLADLEESLGTFQVCELPVCAPELIWRGLDSILIFLLFRLQSTKAVYDRIIDLRIATPQIIINYAMFLEEHNYFEESFKVNTCPSYNSVFLNRVQNDCFEQGCFFISRRMSVALLSSSGPMFMTSGTPTSQSSLTVTGERSWREPEICSNKPWTAAPPSSPKVCPSFPPSWRHFLALLLTSPYYCLWCSSNLPAVRQIGGGIRLGSARHGCLREGDGSSGDWGEAPHVQHLHQESGWDIRSHLHQSHLPEGNRGQLALTVDTYLWPSTPLTTIRQRSLLAQFTQRISWWSKTGFFFLLLQVLPDEHARDMCQRFADMESKLGEIDRARAIYSYCSQICDPRVRLTVHFVEWCTRTFSLAHLLLAMCPGDC